MVEWCSAFTAEDEVVVLPGFTGFEPLSCLPRVVASQRCRRLLGTWSTRRDFLVFGSPRTDR